MPPPDTAHIDRVQGSAADGRAGSRLYRGVQLRRLHDAVAAGSAALERAVVADGGPAVTPADARLELCMALRAVRGLARRLDVDGTAAAPHAVMRPVGVVVVVPAAHTFVYCAVVAVAAALAGGNCVVLQLETSANIKTPTALREALAHTAIDHATIALATAAEVAAAAFHVEVMHFIQDEAAAAPAGSPTTHHRLLACPAARRVVAIVERDADLDGAAEALVAARLALGGTSPYAPDLVLVNEWVLPGLLEAVLRHTARAVAARRRLCAGAGPVEFPLLDRARAEGSCRVVSHGDEHAVVVVTGGSREWQLVRAKVAQPLLVLQGATSSDDAIDAAGAHGPLLAAYVFGARGGGGAAAYAARFVDAAAVFVNHVPARLLVGPARPAGVTTAIDPALFTVPRPVISKPAAADADDDALVVRSTVGDNMTELTRDLRTVLPPVPRPERQVGLDFFEQGLVTGGVVLMGSVVAAVGIVAFQGYKLMTAPR